MVDGAMKMKKLLITQCPDPFRWYADKIGQHVPFMGDVGTEYDDCEVVEVDE